MFVVQSRALNRIIAFKYYILNIRLNTFSKCTFYSKYKILNLNRMKYKRKVKINN